MSGRSRKRKTNPSAIEISVHFATGDSSLPRCDFSMRLRMKVVEPEGADISVLETIGPTFEQVDHAEENERNRDEHNRDTHGGLVFVFFEQAVDEQWGDLGFVLEIAGDKNDGAEFANRAREGEREA